MSIFQKIKSPGLLTVAAIAIPISMAALAIHASQRYTENTIDRHSLHPAPNIVKTNNTPKIQLAILLDTSSSMSGLIDQSRQQIWQVVNEFVEAKRDGVKPILEVAVYEYGNDHLSGEQGHIRQVSALTSELDQVSEALFSLTTNGGQEYCGYVIKTAVDDLAWSDSNNDIKAIFIAGNEPFTQGPVRFQDAIAKAKKKGIVVNTIHAGNHHEGLNSGWKDGAVLAGGNFMSINHNQKVVHVNAPQDKRLAELNNQLNKTYIPYGAEGKKKMDRQASQDLKNRSISAGLSAKRTRSKASSYYSNSTWDLVDAEKNGKVDLDNIAEAKLPEKMRAMSKSERKTHVKETANKRAQIKKEILALSKSRDNFVAKEKQKKLTSKDNTMDEALTQAIRAQAKQKNFTLN